MMTKDKKPFTYTPGMGGKLDLSQIRSPRMARRVAKNANDEGIEGPPKSSLAADPRPVSTGSNLYIQPQVAVPVFPTNVPLQPSSNRAPSAPASRVPSNASDRVVEVQRPVTRVEMKPTTQVVSPQPTPPETPTTPPQVTLAKAPTPWLQNKNKPQEELPEWAKRANVNRPSSSTSPESPNSHTAQIQINQPQVQQTIQLQQPPLTRQHQPPPPPRQQSLAQERVIPLRIEDRPSVFSVKHEPGHHQFKQQSQQPSPHHQQRWGNSTSPQTPVQAQSPQYPNQNQPQQYPQPSRPQSTGGGTYIVPIMVEGANNNGPSATMYNQPQQVQARSQPIQNQSPRVIVQRGPPSPQIQQGEGAPLQSRSFRVLQKITDTDVPDEVDGEQMRKLQLTEDDKILMNKFKEQVDGDGTYLHQEEDPRYRGAAIPSRAFRFLQNMTESGDVTTTANVPRAPSAINKRQNRNSRTFEESQANLPASEQQAPEPKKYTGSAIPSRSFRILQAMTSPESIAKQENRQAVVTCRTESSMQPVNQQQSVFLSSPSSYDSSSEPLAPSRSQQSQSWSSQSQSQPPQLQPLPPPFWQLPEGSCWWGYYPFHYSAMANMSPTSSSSPLELSSTTQNNTHNIASYESYAYCTGYHHHPHHHHHHLLQDGNAFAYYHPLYDQRLFAPAALSSPNCLSSTSSSFSSDSTAVAAAAPAAVRQCTDMSSSSSNGEELTVVTLNKLPLNDTGVSFIPTSSSSSSSSSSTSSSSSSSVSSRIVAARAPSTIVHPASTACFVPAFIHHQPTKESPGYDSNCNPCLERTAAGATTIFRCPPMCLPNSVNPDEGLSGSGGKNVWACQDPALIEPGPPPWSQYYQNRSCSDIQRDENIGSEEKFVPGWNLDGSIGQRKDQLIPKEDDAQGSRGRNNLVPTEKVDTSNSKWSRNHRDDKEDDVDRLRTKSHSILTDEDDKTRNSTCKTLNSEDNPTDLVIARERPRWIRENFEAKEDDVERSGKNAVTNSVDKLEANDSEWTSNNLRAEENDTEQLGKGIDRNPIDQAAKVEGPRWNRIDNASRNLNELDATIPMNILHEERNANDTSIFNTVNINEVSASLGEDHYSEDGNGTESDSESDSTSSESSGEAEPVGSEPQTNTDEESDSESDSDDSDSYLAYSTGLNPHNVFMTESNSSVNNNHAEKEFRKSQTATTIDEDAFDERSFALSSDRMNSTDCDSCAEEDDVPEEKKIDHAEKAKCEHSKAEDIVPHRLSVILEDEQSKIGSDGWQDIPADDSATVSVSLPLRFRFSVSENDQDVTTVVVGDTTVKTEETRESEECNDVCVNLKINEDTVASVDFTLRKTASQEANEDDFDFWATQSVTPDCKTPEEPSNSQKSDINEGNETEISKEVGERDSNDTNYEDDCIDFWETLKSGNESPDFNFNSRRRLEKSSLPKIMSEEENPEVVVTKEDNLEEEKILATNDVSNCLGKDSEEGEDDDQEEETEEDEEEEEEEEDGEEGEEDLEETTIHKSDENKEEGTLSNNSAPLFELTEAKMEDNDNEEEPTSGRSNVENVKHLLSVQNSRDETDDEDSGVTSDMSRLISEVDTDSECGPTRKINSYKRTQTHSRLFRLLSREDDAQANEEIKSSSARRDRLSLPLKNSGFSYDESHHCSNYSSGLTSPDYSPVYEGSWRRLHEDNAGHPTTPESRRSPAGLINDEEYCKNRKDPYFETWKKSVAEDMIQEERKISSSGTVKMLSNGGSSGGYGLSSWRFRSNVLCPRIKSTKNVPRVMRQHRPAKPVIASSSTSESVVATGEKC